MKPVPEHIIASGPLGTIWFGGAVDRSTMTLRVMAKVRGESVNKTEVSSALGCEPDRENRKSWCLHGPEKEDSNLDSQIEWLLGRVSSDLETWKMITANYRVDIFCGLFMQRTNRGTSLSAKTMMELGTRGIEIGFDIYAPEK